MAPPVKRRKENLQVVCLCRVALSGCVPPHASVSGLQICWLVNVGNVRKSARRGRIWRLAAQRVGQAPMAHGRRRRRRRRRPLAGHLRYGRVRPGLSGGRGEFGLGSKTNNFKCQEEKAN